MVGRKVVVYYAWSRPGEVEAPLEVIENRFPTLFESRHGKLAAAMLGATVAYWHIASFRCAAEFGRYRGIADMAGITAGWLDPVANDPKSDMAGQLCCDAQDTPLR